MIKDFKEYFVSIQKNYTETLKVLEQINKELEEGKCTWEQREAFVNYFNNIQANYERLSYVKYLLQKPPKFIQKLQEKKLAKEQEKFLKRMKDHKADAESVIEESEENLQAMKDLLNEVNSEGENV